MSRRVGGAIVAVVLALIGTGVLVGVVRGAEERALEGAEMVQVILIDGDVPVQRGTAVERLPLRLARMPQATVAASAVENVMDVADMVTAVELLPGEQLLAERLISVEEFEEEVKAEAAPYDLPPGYLEISVPIPAERALGGKLEVGEHIALIGIFQGAADPETEDPNAALEGQQITSEDVIAFEAPPPDASTHLLVDSVLVTGIQVDELPAAVPSVDLRDDDPEDAPGPEDVIAAQRQPTQTPSGNFLLSLALRAYDVERVVFAQEYGSLWIARNPSSADLSGTRLQTYENIYERTNLPLIVLEPAPEQLAFDAGTDAALDPREADPNPVDPGAPKAEDAGVGP